MHNIIPIPVHTQSHKYAHKITVKNTDPSMECASKRTHTHTHLHTLCLLVSCNSLILFCLWEGRTSANTLSLSMPTSLAMAWAVLLLSPVSSTTFIFMPWRHLTASTALGLIVSAITKEPTRMPESEYRKQHFKNRECIYNVENYETVSVFTFLWIHAEYHTTRTISPVVLTVYSARGFGKREGVEIFYTLVISY